MATLNNVIVNTLYKGLFITAEAPLCSFLFEESPV